MLTRQGLVAVGAGVIAVVVARVFGVLELYIIGAGFLVAAIVALAIVWIRRPRVRAGRWIHPSMLVAGDTGRVDLHLEHLGAMRSSNFSLSEDVRRPGSGAYGARLLVASMAPRSLTTTGYQLITSTRGVIRLGPLVAEHRDPLGIARTRTTLLDVDEVSVAPRSYLLDMPQLGQGLLGAHLLTMARRLGPGEFHGLREYVDGDEPRSIHWKASARSEQLLVKEHTTEGLRRCTIVLDASAGTYAGADGFERAVTAAAGLVHSADTAGLTTRFVTSGGIDLRGPEVAPRTLRLLARIEPDDEPLGPIEHDPGDGLGLLILISSHKTSIGVRAGQAIFDPTQTAVVVMTEEPARSSLDVPARTEREFVASWQALTGRGPLDIEANRP